MVVHRVETTLSQDKTLILQDLPFEAGDNVEIVIFKREQSEPSTEKYPLRGQKVVYLQPTEPVAGEDWNMMKNG